VTTWLTSICVPQVTRLLDAGVPVIASAGNGLDGNSAAVDAREVTPARVPRVITVGATTIDDTWAELSNFGPRVDILAPGEFIMSAIHDDNKLLGAMSGTSQAA
jgi:subtilisin family serine protease